MSTATHPVLTRGPGRPAGSSQSLLGLLGFAVTVALAAGVGGLAASSAASIYADLEQPSFAPPSWVFGPVWTALYALIAVAGWRVWRRYGIDRAFAFWVVQIVLNALWTPLFFGAGQFGLALVDIVLLDLAVVATIVLFARRDRIAAWLLTPYLAWTLFATALNFAFWQLN